jgi:hypothetical protein
VKQKGTRMGENRLVDFYIQDKLAQRDRKHRDEYTLEIKRHLEGVETITRAGETDQGVTMLHLYFCSVK